MSKLKTTIGDYRDVEILPDSVIYADIPYKFSRGYGDDEEFDVDKIFGSGSDEPVPPPPAPAREPTRRSIAR